MNDSEIRISASNKLLGVSFALIVIVDGIRGQFEPGAWDEREAAELHEAIAILSRAGEKLALLGQSLRYRERLG